MRNIGFAAVACTVLLLTGCGPRPAEPEDASADAAPAAQGAELEAEPDPFAGLGTGWNVIEPGGDTICSDGSAYRFFAKAGDPERLLVYLQGGGACWFGRNCDPHLDPSYKATVDVDELESYRGIFELDNPENPFAGYSFVVVPYCTADVHLGNNVATYEAPAAEQHQAHPVTIHHKGIANVQTALAWTYERFDPTEIFVTGSSAGAIPSPYYAWKIAERYPDARIAQLGDGAGGYRRSGDTNLARMEQWGTMSHLQQYPEFAEMPISEFAYEHLYVAAARRFPNITFAEYDAAEDSVQKRFLAMGGSDTASLLDLLHANHADVRAEVDNFRTYIAGGDSHTILARPEFYTFQVNGRRVRDWVAELAAYQDVENVACDPCGVAEVTPAVPEGGQ